MTILLLFWPSRRRGLRRFVLFFLFISVSCSRRAAVFCTTISANFSSSPSLAGHFGSYFVLFLIAIIITIICTKDEPDRRREFRELEDALLKSNLFCLASQRLL